MLEQNVALKKAVTDLVVATNTPIEAAPDHAADVITNLLSAFADVLAERIVQAQVKEGAK